MRNAKPGRLLIAIVVLALVNLTTLALLWFRVPGPPPRQDARAYLIRVLRLDSMQERQFDSLRREHFTEVGALQEETHRLKDVLLSRLSGPGSEAGPTADSIGALQAKIERATFRHFAALRRLCNPAQQQDFDRVIRDVLRTLAPPGGPPPRRD